MDSEMTTTISLEYHAYDNGYFFFGGHAYSDNYGDNYYGYHYNYGYDDDEYDTYNDFGFYHSKDQHGLRNLIAAVPEVIYNSLTQRRNSCF